MRRYARMVLVAALLVAGLVASTHAATAAPASVCRSQRNCHVLTIRPHTNGCAIYVQQASKSEDGESYGTYASWDGPVQLPLYPGGWRVRFEDQWYGGGSFATATVFSMKSDVTLSPRTCYLSRPHYVTEVVNANGQPVPGVRMVSYGADDPTQVRCRHTSRDFYDGYATHNFGCGTKVHLIDPTGRYRSTWADGADTFHGSTGQFWRMDGHAVMTRIEPLAPHDPYGQGDRSADLQSYFTVADHTSLDGEPYLYDALIQLFRADDDTSSVAHSSSTNGYHFADVDSGDYKVKLADGLWYGGETFADATVLHLVPGVNRADWTLPHSGNFSGRVVDSHGGPPGGVLISAIDATNGEVVARTTTYDEDGPGEGGDFHFDALISRPYVFEASDVEGRFRTRWYGSASDRADARVYPTDDGHTTDLGTLVLPTGLMALTAPTLSGSATVGHTLHVATPGTWSQRGLRYRYQWLLDGVPVDGATGPSFAVHPRHRGGAISVRATASKTGYPDATGASRETAPVR